MEVARFEGYYNQQKKENVMSTNQIVANAKKINESIAQLRLKLGRELLKAKATEEYNRILDEAKILPAEAKKCIHMAETIDERFEGTDLKILEMFSPEALDLVFGLANKYQEIVFKKASDGEYVNADFIKALKKRVPAQIAEDRKLVKGWIPGRNHACLINRATFLSLSFQNCINQLLINASEMDAETFMDVLFGRRLHKDERTE